MVNSAFGLFLIPVYARHLTAREYGILSLLTITLTLVTIVLKFGLNHAFFRHYYDSDDPEDRRRIVGTTLGFLLVTTVLLNGAFYWLAPQLSGIVFSGNGEYAHLLRYMFLIAFFDVMVLVPDSILRASFRSAQYSALNAVAFAVQIALISYLVLVVDSTVENVLIGRLVGVAFGALLFFFVVRRELSLVFSVTELKGMLAFGAPLIFGQIAFILFMMIDRFFLDRFTNAREVGVYGLASTLVSVVTILATVPFSQVWTVMRFSVMNEEGAEEYYSRVLTYILLVSMFLALGVAAVAGDGLLLYSLRSYWAATAIIPLLAFAAVLDSASRVLNIGITLRKRTMYAPVVITAALAVNIVLNFILIPRYKSLGATISTVVSYLVFCGLRYWASNLFFKVRYEWRRVAMIMAVGVALIGAFYLVDQFRGDLSGYGAEDPTRRATLWISIGIKSLLALSFPLLLLPLGFYHERELHRVRDFIRKLAGEFRRVSADRPAGKAVVAVAFVAGVVLLLISVAGRLRG